MLIERGALYNSKDYRLMSACTEVQNLFLPFVDFLHLHVIFQTGSPFLLNVGGEPSGRIRETVTREMEQAEAVTPNTKCEFLLKIPGKKD